MTTSTSSAACRRFSPPCPARRSMRLREGLRSQGATNNQTVLITETLMDSKVAVPHGEHRDVYNLMWLDLKDGPLVIEMPPNIVGIIDDFWFHYVGDVGQAGPDRGKGGKFLLLPPGYTGEVPRRLLCFPLEDLRQCFLLVRLRGQWRSQDPRSRPRRNSRRSIRWRRPKTPPPMKFINVSGKAFNTIPCERLSPSSRR